MEDLKIQEWVFSRKAPKLWKFNEYTRTLPIFEKWKEIELYGMTGNFYEHQFADGLISIYFADLVVSCLITQPGHANATVCV